MPPKKDPKKHAEESEDSIASDATSRLESEASTLSVPASVLERILAANNQSFIAASRDSMHALLAALPSAGTATLTSETVATTARTHIKIPKWSDEEIPFEYFGKFEKALKHNRIPRAEWGQLLPVYLSGRAQASFAQVGEDMMDDYDLVKETMLESLGDTTASADRRWWSLARQAGEDVGAFYLRVRSTGLRRLHGLKTREEITEQLILSRFLSLLPQDCYSNVVTKCPKNGLEASRLVQEFEETRSFARRHQPWRNSSAGQRTYSNGSRGSSDHGPKRSVDGEQHGSDSGNNSSSGNSSSASNVDSNIGNTRNSNPQTHTSGRQAGGGRNRSDRQDQGGRRPITCYSCGEQGHIKPNCPNRVRRVRSPGHSSVMLVEGSMAG